MLLHLGLLPMYMGVMVFCSVLTCMNFRNSCTNCTRIDVINTMDHPPICYGQVYEPMNVFDLGMCRNWVSDFGWNPLLWWFPGRSDDEHGTYTGHRFPAWALLKPEEVKQLSKEKLEVIAPGPKYLNFVARNRARRFQQVIQQNMAVGA